MYSLLPVKVLEKYRQFGIQLVEERGAAVCCPLFLTIHTALFCWFSVWALVVGLRISPMGVLSGSTVPALLSVLWTLANSPPLSFAAELAPFMPSPGYLSLVLRKVQAQQSGSKHVYTHFLGSYD